MAIETRTRIFNLKQEIAKGGFIPIAEALAKHAPAQLGPRAGTGTSQTGQSTMDLPGYDVKFLVEDENSKHLIEIVQIAPRQRKYRHRHNNAENVLVFLEGVGEYYPTMESAVPVKAGDMAHALPGEVHGVGNTGDVPLYYLVVEGPMPMEMDRLD